MEQFAEGESTREEIKNKLRQNFDGKIVRKDLTKKIKEGANVPVYVLEFLLGQYCSSDDETVIEKGVQNVKRILADNFVRPDESQKILSQLRKKGSHTIIDMVTVRLDMKKDCFFAEFSNLGVGNVPIADEYPEKFDRLLCGGIWCIVQLDYELEGDNNFGIEDIDGNPLRSKQKKQKDISPISIRKLTPIQMPHIDIDELKQGRKAFTKDEWLDILLRSIGMEPDEFTYREKWLLLTRMIPLVENNFNLCELGPRSTGKSHLYKEISPNSILISGGQTTVANLFYNMGRKTVGLVGLWDCVAFDEVAGIKFKDKDGIQIMKDYMASGSFARGKEEKAATASMVFVESIYNSDIIKKASDILSAIGNEILKIGEAVTQIESTSLEFADVVEMLSKKIDGLSDEFAEIKREIKDDTLDIDGFVKMTEELEKCKENLKQLDERAKSKKQIESAFKKAMRERNDILLEQFNAYKLEIQKINESQNELKITIDFKGDRDNFKSQMKTDFRGSGISEIKYQSLCDTFRDYVELIEDWILCDGIKIKEIISSSEYTKLNKKLQDQYADLLKNQVSNNVEIYYHDKLLRHHSIGQRASALILFILMQSDNDIILIDQPEDDLDNKIIYDEVITAIAKKKQDIQFIFATHNANIPVLGDAERIFVVEYQDTTIDISQGNIDLKSTHKQIVDIMEGGEEAFDKRQLIYTSWK